LFSCGPASPWGNNKYKQWNIW